MRTFRSTPAVALVVALVGCALHPSDVAANPVEVSGVLSGVSRFALVDQELQLAFPDFTILIDPQTQLTPRFPLVAGEGSAISLTRTLGPFSAHSFGLPGSGTLDADVTGTLSFAGPTEIFSVPSDGGFGEVTGPVPISGSLLITQSDRVLFDGTLLGTGLATVGYEDRFGRGEFQLAGYTYQFNALASTPEPASLLLALTGASWVMMRRRRDRGAARPPEL